MAKLKHETELVKAAIVAGVKYAEDRGAAVFEPTDSASERFCISTVCWCTTR